MTYSGSTLFSVPASFIGVPVDQVFTRIITIPLYGSWFLLSLLSVALPDVFFFHCTDKINGHRDKRSSKF